MGWTLPPHANDYLDAVSYDVRRQFIVTTEVPTSRRRHDRPGAVSSKVHREAEVARDGGPSLGPLVLVALKQPEHALVTPST